MQRSAFARVMQQARHQEVGISMPTASKLGDYIEAMPTVGSMHRVEQRYLLRREPRSQLIALGA
jgi:hypothetical protein